MRKDLLLELADRIEQIGRIRMEYWITILDRCVSKNTSVDQPINGLKHLTDSDNILHEKLVEKTECNTVGCIAGIAASMFNIKGLLQLNNLLELSQEDSIELFQLTHWPLDFRAEYFSAKTYGDCAKVCADRIRHLVESES